MDVLSDATPAAPTAAAIPDERLIKFLRSMMLGCSEKKRQHVAAANLEFTPVFRARVDIAAF
jgi:hypothetical protein